MSCLRQRIRCWICEIFESERPTLSEVLGRLVVTILWLALAATWPSRVGTFVFAFCGYEQLNLTLYRGLAYLRDHCPCASCWASRRAP